MGASVFIDRSAGTTVDKAFRAAVDAARSEDGCGGYSGTIAEKSSFVMITLPEGADPWKEANRLIDESDPRIDDKWGPAGCFRIGPDEYVFFGWASD